jgi:hypothetical protein
MTYFGSVHGLRQILGGWLKSALRVLTLLLIPAMTMAGSPEADGGVVLRWTAPGDDHYTGTATGYIIRYRPGAEGPIDTESDWEQAIGVANVPAPSPAGQTDSVVVLGLVSGEEYYFALRSYDEAMNISLISNSPGLIAVDWSCCQGKVGDVNGVDGDKPTIGDVSLLIDHLFIRQQPVWCPAEADVNQSGGLFPQQGPDGDLSIGDISLLIEHLFVNGYPIPDCLSTN